MNDIGPQYVELVNGQIVMRDAEEWRDECLARYVLSLPSLKERRAWLADFEKRHGNDEAERLKANMLAVRGGEYIERMRWSTPDKH